MLLTFIIARGAYITYGVGKKKGKREREKFIFEIHLRSNENVSNNLLKLLNIHRNETNLRSNEAKIEKIVISTAIDGNLCLKITLNNP